MELRLGDGVENQLAENGLVLRCDASYPTICIPPPPPDIGCGDVPYTDFTVLPPDSHDFDHDGDGLGCETQGAGR